MKRDPLPASLSDLPYPESRVVLPLVGGARHVEVDSSIGVLANCPDVFQRGGELIRVLAASEIDLARVGVTRVDGTRLLVLSVSADWLATQLSRHIRFERVSKTTGRVRPANPPSYLASAVLAEGSYRGIRKLSGITSAPVIRSDGSVFCAAGYDAQTGMIVQDRGPLPDCSRSFSQDVAAAAYLELCEPFDQYPFADEASKSVCVSLVLTRLARHLFDLAPLHLFTAPVAGSGKTFIVECASAIVDSARASVRSWPSSEEELGKCITSALLAGHGLMLFDNLPNGYRLQSPKLDGLLTAPIWTDRLLGTAREVSIVNNMTVAATGNNIEVMADTVRRTICARVVPDVQDPTERAFDWTPLEYAQAHRQRLLRAAVVVVASYLQAGMPSSGAKPLDSFEGWSRVVRDSLLWAGAPDPASTQQSIKATEPGIGLLGDFLQALEGHFGRRSFKAGDVLRAVQSGAHSMHGSPEANLFAATSCIFDDGKVNAPRVGRYLETHRDRIVDGLALQSSRDTHAKQNVWRVRPGREIV